MNGVAWASTLLLVLAGGAAPPDPALKRNRAEAQRLYREGLDALTSERYEAAEESFRGAVALDPQLFLAYYALGQTRMHTKQFERAVSAYSDSIRAYRDAASGAQDVRLEIAQNREDEIRDLRDRVRELRHELRQSGSAARRAAIEARIGNIEAGILSLERLRGDHLERVEPPAEFFLALGSAYFRSGKPLDARREYLEAVRLRPKYGEAHNNLVVIYMLSGELVTAEEHLKAAEKSGFKVSEQLKKDLREKQRLAKP
jgi:Tfp pilus assembly protein PilF